MNQLRLLLRLQFTQQRRDFSWKTLFIGAYFTVLFIVVVMALYVPLREHLESATQTFEMLCIAPMLAVGIIPGDLLMKLFWRRSPVEMDDSLRSRPVSSRAWAQFIFIDTALGFLQWMLPLMMAFITALVLPLWAAFLVLLLTFSCTLVNALFQNCWRRAPGNQYTLPLVFGYLVWLGLAYAVAVASFVIVGLAGDDPSTPVQPQSTTWGVLLSSLLLLWSTPEQPMPCKLISAGCITTTRRNMPLSPPPHVRWARSHCGASSGCSFCVANVCVPVSSSLLSSSS